MRSHQNLSGSHNRRVGSTLNLSGIPMSGMPMSSVARSSVPRSSVPMEWLDARSWRLPSGKALAEFALQTGFLAPLLFRSEPSRPTAASLDDVARSKALRKGEQR
jgi:hypothetical protein